MKLTNVCACLCAVLQQGGELFKMLIQYSKLLPLEREVIAVYYKLLAVIVLECGKNKLHDCLHLIIKLQVCTYKYA